MEAVRSPGRPRSAAADLAILHAALELLVAEGYRALTMDAVRERSGVGKATLYRRHASKQALVRAVVEHLREDVPVPDDTGSLAGDFADMARTAEAAAQSTRLATFVPRVLTEVAHIPELQPSFYDALVRPRRDAIAALLRRAVDRGEIRADVDLELTIDAVVGPVIYKTVVTGGDLGQLAGMPARVLELVMEGLRPR